MPSADAHTHDDGAGGRSGPERPILLSDIDQVLEASSDVDQAPTTAPIRAWRDELTVAVGSLAYARDVLAGDVAILRHCLASAGYDRDSVVSGLPSLLAAHPWGSGWSAAHAGPDLAVIDGEFFVRSDELMTAHREMALLDLSAPQEVARVLRHAEEQLTAITERHAAAEARLQQLRAAIIRQYRQGVIPARNRPA